MKLEIKGGNELLVRLKRNAEFKDVKNAVKVNTAEMMSKAQRNAPVDTGFLKRSIVPNVTAFRGEVKATANYSPFLEYGTRFQVAQPFLFPAFQSQKPLFLRDLKRLVE